MIVQLPGDDRQKPALAHTASTTLWRRESQAMVPVVQLLASIANNRGQGHLGVIELDQSSGLIGTHNMCLLRRVPAI